MSSGVLFDLDDTLFDHQHARRSALMALIAAYPALTGQSVETMERAHEHHLQSTHKRLLRGEITLSDARRERMRLLFVERGAVAHDGDWDHVEHVYRSSYNDNRRAIPGVIALIDKLRPSRKLGIITNGLVIEQEEKIHLCGLRGRMDAILISERFGKTKPDRGFFELALAALGTSPEETTLVGDSWSNDILGAQRCGIRTIWLNRYAQECPDPRLALEIKGFEPMEPLLQAITCPQSRVDPKPN